jgi:hypothetical protein
MSTTVSMRQRSTVSMSGRVMMRVLGILRPPHHGTVPAVPLRLVPRMEQ